MANCRCDFFHDERVVPSSSSKFAAVRRDSTSICLQAEFIATTEPIKSGSSISIEVKALISGKVWDQWHFPLLRAKTKPSPIFIAIGAPLPLSRNIRFPGPYVSSISSARPRISWFCPGSWICVSNVCLSGETSLVRNNNTCPRVMLPRQVRLTSSATKNGKSSSV